MAFERPVSIKEVVEKISRHEYVLPAIQREFVWKPEQVVRLFDSLLKDYPIGSFLFWAVAPENKGRYAFYDFLRNYHERDAVHNPRATLLGDGGVTAVLDGQQRLTSLFIGLHGTYAERRKYAWRHVDASYPRRRLYLNLARPSDDFELDYDFRFREDDADFRRDGDDFWFRAGHVLNFREPTSLMDLIIDQGLTADKYAMHTLTRLHRAVVERPLVNYYLEQDQDLDKVLNIFIRVNSGGTILSYSDLLLSIATAQWEGLDAREEIHALVDEINTEYGDFGFTKDFVLKSALMLADLDIRWKVENFTLENLRTIEARWRGIAGALRAAVKLVASFGFNASTLTSASAVIPIVYYLYRRGNPAGYVDADAHREDRERIRRWLLVTTLKRTFGGVPDNVLRPIRDVLREHHGAFPAREIAEVLAATPRSLRFEPGELEALLDVKYGGTYAFSVLSLLFPTLDVRNRFHQDHVHPRSAFTRAQLARRGIPEEDRAFYAEHADRLPNLQLLEGLPNQEKSDRDFAAWLASRYPGEAERAAYRERHLIPDVDLSFGNFREFYERRRALMLDRLRALVEEPAAGVAA